MDTCSDKIRLFELFQAATGAHAEAVAQLHGVIGTSSKADYDILYRKAERLRLDALTAQADLQSHVAEHNC